MEFFQNLEFKDYSWPEITAFGFVGISLAFCLCLSLLKFYRKRRHSIPVQVNCWFCNTDTKVHYLSRDGWNCPSCQQYNGFNKDGGYNKRIPAQYIESLNRPIFPAPAENYPASTFQLCDQCNANQELKTFQLAQFIPLNEDRFDEEIEAEQQRLEQIYDICKGCKNVVKQALSRKQSGIQIKQRPKSNLLQTNNVRRPLRPRTPIPIPVKSETPRNVADEDKCNWNSINAKQRKQETGAKSKVIDYTHIFDTKLTELHIGSPNQKSQPLSRDGSFYQNGSFNSAHSSPSPTSASSINGFVNEKPNWANNGYLYNNPPTYSNFMFNHAGSCGNLHASSAYNYRSSPVGTVFGGQKPPLLSPSRLSATINSQSRRGIICQCQMSNLAYHQFGIVYGSPYSQYNNYDYINRPFSSSSSQSSGFASLSRDQSCSNTPTPPGLSNNNNYYCASSTASLRSAFSPFQQQSSIYPEDKGFGIFQQSSSMSAKARSHTSQSRVSKVSSKKVKQIEEEERNWEKEVYSDDSNDELISNSSTTKSKTLHNQRKNAQTVASSKKQEQEETKSRLDEIKTKFHKRFMNFSFRPIFNVLIRLILVVHVLLLFCILFAGQWPKPVDNVIVKATHLYSNVFRDYIYPLFVHFENGLNNILSYILPEDEAAETEFLHDSSVIDEALFKD